ncbi:MICOS complex subunit [Schizosaccharomyces pombe]
MSYYYETEEVNNNPELKSNFPWLADRIHEGRSSIFHALGYVGLKTENAFGWFLSTERKTISTAKNEVFSSDERKLPGVAYVVVGGMAGNIFARNRIAPARWLITSLSTAATFMFCFPKTSTNIGAFVEKRFPAIRKQRMLVLEQTQKNIQNAQKSMTSAVEGVQKHYEDAVKKIKGD